MNVVLCWSGDFSHAVAESLREVLSDMLQTADFFLSSHDIESGTQWMAELTDKLDESSIGVMCLTPANKTNPWIHFEAGALAKRGGRPCGLYLNGLRQPDVEPPLSLFQNREFSRDGVKFIVETINKRLDRPLEQPRLDRVFATNWPRLQTAYEAIIDRFRGNNDEAPPRNDRSILEEILLAVRANEPVVSHTRSDRLGVEVEVSPVPLPLVTAESILSQRINNGSLATYTQWKFADQGFNEKLQRTLLRDLNLERFPTLREIDQAVERSRPAVEAYAKEKPEWFKSGTDYLTKSLGFADQEFRKKHGFAPATRNAFNRLEHLVRNAI